MNNDSNLFALSVMSVRPTSLPEQNSGGRVRRLVLRTVIWRMRPCIKWPPVSAIVIECGNKRVGQPCARELDTIAPRTRREIKCQKIASLLTHSEAWTQRETKIAESRGHQF